MVPAVQSWLQKLTLVVGYCLQHKICAIQGSGLNLNSICPVLSSRTEAKAWNAISIQTG